MKYTKRRMTLPDTTSTKPIKIYTDKAGNTLWTKFIKSRGTQQIFGKNKQGRIVTEEDTMKLYKQYQKKGYL